MEAIATPKVTLSFLPELYLASGQPIVDLIDGEPTTTSRKVAEFFDRDHRNVLASIDDWLTKIDENDHLLYFQQMVDDIEIGSGAVREFRSYRMTEEGFALVAMSFTGEKAAKFKIAYTKAFRMLKREVARLHADNEALLKLQHANCVKHVERLQDQVWAERNNALAPVKLEQRKAEVLDKKIELAKLKALVPKQVQIPIMFRGKEMNLANITELHVAMTEARVSERKWRKAYGELDERAAELEVLVGICRHDPVPFRLNRT